MRSLYLETNDKVLLAAVTNYFRAVIRVCGPDIPADSSLTKTVGVQAMFDLLRELASTALEQKDFSEKWFEEKLHPLKLVDFSNAAFQQASGQGRTLIKRVLFTLVGFDTGLDEERQGEINQLIQDARKDE